MDRERCVGRQAPRKKSQVPHFRPVVDCTGTRRRKAGHCYRGNRTGAGAPGSQGLGTRMNAQKRREIFSRFRSLDPDPRTELAYTTPYELLVAVVLSAQATDKSV